MENWHWHFQFRFIPILSLSYLIPILSLSYPYLMMRDIVCNNRHSNHSNHHLLPSPSGPTYFLRWFEIGPFVLHTPLFVANITLPQTLRALQWLAISPGIWYFISSPASLLKPICYTSVSQNIFFCDPAILYFTFVTLFFLIAFTDLLITKHKTGMNVYTFFIYYNIKIFSPTKI